MSTTTEEGSFALWKSMVSNIVGIRAISETDIAYVIGSDRNSRGATTLAGTAATAMVVTAKAAFGTFTDNQTRACRPPQVSSTVDSAAR